MSVGAGWADTVRTRAALLSSAGEVISTIEESLVAAGSLGWQGQSAAAFDAIQHAQRGWLRQAHTEIQIAEIALLRLIDTLDDADRVIARWRDLVAEAEGAHRRAIAAAADGSADTAAVDLALAELTDIRIRSRQATEAVDLSVAVGDRETARVLTGLLVSGRVSITGSRQIAALGALMTGHERGPWVRWLSASQIDHLIATRPELIGSHPDAGFADRYRANVEAIRRHALGDVAAMIRLSERTEGALLGTPLAVPAAWQTSVWRRHQHELLARVEARRTFLSFDPVGDGTMVEVFGDLELARHVAVVVPGITNSQFDYERGFARDAFGLWAGDDDVAVIAWLGYDTPGAGPFGTWPTTPDALSVDEAVTGDWLVATRPDAHVTVIGHSYGSVVAARAAADGLAADALVLVGSPGVPLHDADAAKLREGGVVWASLAEGDPIADLASLPVVSNYPDDAHGAAHGLLHGINPVHLDFGAVPLAPFEGTGHSAYFAAGGAAALREIIRTDSRKRTEPTPGVRRPRGVR
jgi:pimeloyl-ACP methyl ester carboxylesterase